MKKIILISLLLGGVTSWAQDSTPPATPQAATSEADTKDAIAKPTSAQKKTIKSATEKAKANKKESATAAPEIIVPPEVSDETTSETETTVKKKQKKAILIDSSANRFGLHADLNIPHILNYGVDYWHVSKWFSASLNFGGYAVKGIQKSDDLPNGVDVKIANQEAVLRIHPFQSAFYLALAYGHHQFEGEGTATYSQAPLFQPVTTTIKNKITANYLKPHLGWMWRAESGFTWGMDFGYLIPNGGEVTLDEGSIKNDPLYPSLISTSQYKANRQKIIDDSEKLRTTSLPYWAIVRLGWLF